MGENVQGFVAQLRARISSGQQRRGFELCFDQPNILRAQPVHDGLTWNSGVNRAQVGDGAAILSSRMPGFIDLMMDNPDKDWGKPFYPVVE
ncbi:MAG: hypothetical protein CVT81_05170 [Alphaproteobacteria bacterium HGW-Alphaproteobacteria-3]|nr:MAG: hypothetical protein CVT81_05170 [Alphaproteobacteria bacterium HGW-Alphaproteobacteria-3]